MAFTTYLGRIKNNFPKQDNPFNASKESTPQTSKDNHSPYRTKSPSKTSNKKCFNCLGFDHIAANCPSKRTMMVKGLIVVNDHSGQSSRSNSPNPSKPLVKMNVRYLMKVTYWW